MIQSTENPVPDTTQPMQDRNALMYEKHTLQALGEDPRRVLELEGLIAALESLPGMVEAIAKRTAELEELANIFASPR